MKASESLPRLQERQRRVAGDADVASPKFLGRMSWQKGLLETSDPTSRADAALSLRSPTKTLAGSSSAPRSASTSCWPSPPKTASTGAGNTRVGASNSGDGTVMTFDESMDEVERMVREHLKDVQQQRAGGKKVTSTLRQSANRRDPTKTAFEFVPLQDRQILSAASQLSAEDDDAHDQENNEAIDGNEDSAVERDGRANKYFGVDAKAAYYKTFQELHAKTHLFVETRKKQEPVKTLKPSAALNSAFDMRKASFFMSMSQLTKAPDGAPDNGSKVTATAIIKRRLALQPLCASVGCSSLPDVDSSAVSSPSLHSPRVLFLSACIAKSHPAISLVLRKENCRTFDFSHQSLGDDFIIQFATCLPDLPHVEAINACDNRLSDRALNSLLLALENKPNLTKLDISENEIGRDSAKSLRKYIASSLCTLKTLVLNDADIDDHECALFMMAFEQNKSVERLLMASNHVGQTRKSMALGVAAAVAATLPKDTDLAGAPLPTGGEAIGSMLTVNLTIQELDLAWNMLRYNSCLPIANALQLNYNLRELNLSYNGCGDGGAMQLGHALRSNTVLQKLNLAYNSIGAKGSLVLASGLIVNKGLKELILDGNAIGLDSGRELMYASCSRTHTAVVCALSMFECNLTSSKRAYLNDTKSLSGKDDPQCVNSVTNVYNPSDPTGKYVLDLSDPYEHMIAHELLRLATFKKGYRFGKLEHTAATQPKTTTKIELHRETKRKESLVKQDTQATLPESRNSLSVLFERIDKDKSGSVDQTELVEAMKAYGIHIGDNLIARVLNEYDYDKSGALGVDEFEDFFLRCGFAMIDTDHSGALSEEEIEKVLKLMGFENITEREIRHMMTQYDLNGSGEIDEHEFIEFMRAEVLERAVQKNTMGTGSDDSLRKVTRSLEETYELAALRDPSGVIWKVPTSGFLSVEFHYDVDTVQIGGESDVPAFGAGEDQTGRLRPTQQHTSQLIANSAISTLLHNSQNVSKNNEEQAEFLRAVLDSSDLFFTSAQAEDVLTKQGATKSWIRKLHALERIMAQMINRREAITLVNRMIDPAHQWQQRRELRRSIPKLYSVLLGCPTNRYRFDLQSPVDRVALKHLATLAQEEKLFSKNRSGRNDTSQNGDWENFRHARVNGHVWLLTSTFILNSLLGPSNLTLLTKTAPVLSSGAGGFVEGSQVKRFVEFDYVSTTRPPRGTKALTAKRFEQLMDVWQNVDLVVSDGQPQLADDMEGDTKTNAQLRWEILRSHVLSRIKPSGNCSERISGMSLIQVKTTLDGIKRRLELLEMLVSDRWFSCEQAASLISVLPDAIFARARAAVMLFSRLVDLENFVSIFGSLSREDQAECVKRLGWLNIFDPVQPDRQYPPLNLTIRDERELVQLLSKLALTEGRDCWKRASYRTSVSDTSSTVGQSLPLSGWGNPEATGEESLKHHGIVRLRYQSARTPSISSDGDDLRGDMTVRLRLRKYTLCGTRLFLQ